MAGGKIVFELEGEEARAVQAFMNLTDAEKKAEIQAKKIGVAAQRAGQKQMAVGRQVTAGLKSMAMSYLSVGAGITAVVSALKEAIRLDRQFRQGRAERITAAEGALQRLAQLPGPPSQLAADVAAAKKTATAAGVPLQQAAQLQFALGSQGQRRNRQLFARAFSLVDVQAGETPAQLVEGVSTLQRAMGRDRTGNARQILNMISAASGGRAGTAFEGTKVGMTQIAEAAMKPAFSAAQRGESLAGLLATVAAVTNVSESAATAGTDVRAFFAAAGKGGLPGVGGLDIARRLEARGLDERRLRRILPKRAFEGYKAILSQREAIAAGAAQITAEGAVAGPGDLFARQIAARGAIPELRAAEARRRADRPGLTAAGVEMLEFETAEKQLLHGIRGEGGSAVRRFAADRAGEFIDPLGAGPLIHDVMRAATQVDLLRRIVENTGRNAANRNAHVEGGP